MIRSRGAAFAALTLIAVASSASVARADDGPTVFNDNCAVCHSTEAGVDKLGPSLAGVVGRPSASLKEYPYSDAMQKAGVTWTKLVLDKYLTDPQAMVKGTKMLFTGVKNGKDRKALIDYLATLKN
ncbi:MAG TPA: c-type cytochrome [Stellaceae bacterium]|jgi:cytochrome c|nr:c-type cytochrome [Stellaceae bacterium]